MLETPNYYMFGVGDGGSYSIGEDLRGVPAERGPLQRLQVRPLQEALDALRQVLRRELQVEPLGGTACLKLLV